MRELDDTDREILRLLLENGRRPWADIADHVDLSAPAVADRVHRLEELGVVRGFAVDLDRGRLEGTDVLVELVPEPGAVDRVREAVGRLDGVEHRLWTAEGRLLLTLTSPGPDVRGHLETELDLGTVRELSVSLLAGSEWRPDLGEVTLGLACAECDNTVTGEGESLVLDGDRYEFCCPSCLARFEERYERLAEGA
jgi:DNA-binding Lrp family transcriptional regulator